MDWCEIICLSFKDNEIEQLENFAERMFELVSAGSEVTLPNSLLLDALAAYEEGVTE